MIVEDLLSRLDGVRWSGRGYLACCPSHTDKTPSLKIDEGERGVLIHCFAGCRVEEICAALSIGVKDLFVDAPTDPYAMAQQRAQREQERQRRKQKCEAEGAVIDVCKAAQGFIESRHGLDISQWGEEQLHVELNALADAYAVLDSEEIYDH